ncbi:MAG TPA: response regulator [Gemmata sp.]|nr:response regulator [Gemmata sp.]
MDRPVGGLNVLIIDDNQDAADSLAVLLELRSHAVRVAYDGLTGLRAALDLPPDCIISDIHMPGMDGFELARRVRAEPSLARAKLVVLSAYSQPDLAGRAAEAGFDHALTKGSDPAALLEVVGMMEQIKELAEKTQDLAKQNVDLAGQTKDLLEEVKQEVQEVKEEVREVKEEVESLKREVKDLKVEQGES